MKTWQQQLRSFVDAKAEQGRVIIAALAEEFCVSHRADLAEDAEAHMLRRVAGEIRSYLHAGAFTAQKQMMFEGMELPAFIAVRQNGSDETIYVRTGSATWADLEAGRQERVNHVAAAQAKLDSYDESLIRLRPLMENDPTLTVDEALQIMAGQVA
jgi:DeoR/GlpR family transcriptional regulator of sugar metabolism